MITLRRLLPTDINIVIEVSGLIYICINRIDTVGATFVIGTTVVYPTYISDSNFANEVIVYIYDDRPTVIDDRGNTYQEVQYFYENTGITVPRR